MEVIIPRKESIVITTIDVMNEFGVQALSTREVARREGVSESAIFKHYPKKSDLIYAVLETYSNGEQEIFDSIVKKDLEVKQAIVSFIENYTTYFQNYPAITSITQGLDEMSYHPAYKEKVKLILKNRHNFMTKLIDKGQKDGEIKYDSDKVALAEAIMGTLNGICLNWRIGNYDFSLKEHSLSAVQIILKAV